MNYSDFPNFPGDIHTHHERPDAIVNAEVGDTLQPGITYSLGVHPWNAETWSDDTARRLAAQAADPRVLAIGEAGLDKLRGPSMEVQTHAFEAQARIADELGKPLIIHCVRAFNELMAIKRAMRPRVPWIVHGFRGKPQLARQLLDAGFHLSLGSRHNPDTARLLADHPSRLLRETDEDTARWW